MTEADCEAALGATIDPRIGEETGPSDGFLRAGDSRNVFMGDFARGIGCFIEVCLRSVRTAVGSGIVPGIGQYYSIHSLDLARHTLSHFHILLI